MNIKRQRRREDERAKAFDVVALISYNEKTHFSRQVATPYYIK